MNFAVLVFPGTWSERDCQYVLAHELGQRADLVWHRDSNIDDYDAVVIPGGFSYGDHLRTGAIARFSPVMEAVTKHAAAGKPVIGICNGFQILCEAGLLPGILMPNDSTQFRCVPTHLRVETTDSPFTSDAQKGEILRVPVAHGEGCYFADERTLDELEAEDRIVFRYLDNPNGSLRDIAGILNKERNVMGMMPHPERAADPLMGSTDGLFVLRSLQAAGALKP